MKSEVTKNAAVVLALLKKAEGHMSATSIWERCRELGHSISLATVYNSLRSLHASGRVLEIACDEGGALYDARIDPHAHLHCEECGKLEDIDLDMQLADSLTALAARGNFIAERAEITMKGLCSMCQKERSS